MKNFCTKLCCLSSSSSIKFCGMSTNRSVKFINLVILISLYTGTFIMNKIKSSGDALEGYDCQGKQHEMKCVNEEIQFRNMASYSTILLLLAICMFFKPEIAKIINEGMWIIKLIILGFIMTIFMLLIPQSIINIMEIISSYMTFLYYLFQNLLLIDCIFKIDSYLTQLISSNNNAKKCLALKLIMTTYMCFASIYMNIMSYFQLPLYYSITNSVLMVILFIIVVLRVFPNNTLLIWGTVTLLVNMLTFLCFSLQNVEQNTINYIEIIFQFGLTILFFIGMLTSNSNRIRTKQIIINQVLALTTTNDEDQARYIASSKWKMYYLVMAICVVSLPAVLHLKYHSGLQEQQTIIQYSRIWGIASAYIIYIWSLIASKLYKADDFNELENYFRQFELN